MTPWQLAWRRVVRRPATSGLVVLLLALGVASIAAITMAMRQAGSAAERNAAAADLVIGTKSSAVQLVLAGVFHLDAPPPPFELAAAQAILAHRSVERWVPVALGDSLAGHRVVGTAPQAFAALYGGALRAGGWPEGHGDAVLGAEVARRTGLAVGDRFATAHGLSEGGEQHEGHDLQVAGVLARTNTVLDQLALVPLEAVWRAHGAAEGHEPFARRPDDPTGKVSLVLVTLRSPLGRLALPRLVDATTSLQAASPASESVKLFAAAQFGADAMRLLGGVLLACAGLAVCAGLVATQRERLRDVAVLRLVGASRGATVRMVLAEAVLLGAIGAVLGLALAHAAIELIGRQLPAAAPSLDGTLVEPWELGVAVAAVALAAMGALLPAWRVQRLAVSDALQAQ